MKKQTTQMFLSATSVVPKTLNKRLKNVNPKKCISIDIQNEAVLRIFNIVHRLICFQD
jgi:hypothetical protein